MSAAQRVDVLAAFPAEIFTRGKSDFGYPIVRRVFVERLRSRWAVKQTSYFIGETPAWDYTTRTMPPGTACGCGEAWPLIWSTHSTKHEAATALARIGGAA